ncbi:hypothetical protein MKEN_00155200 [Mycena kentingensis (nom. inval.)]|nr:hypothetical protein MKEN_00155200 [Mycena kentingensis (nom. inval.)]
MDAGPDLVAVLGRALKDAQSQLEAALAEHSILKAAYDSECGNGKLLREERDSVLEAARKALEDEKQVGAARVAAFVEKLRATEKEVQKLQETVRERAGEMEKAKQECETKLAHMNQVQRALQEENARLAAENVELRVQVRVQKARDAVAPPPDPTPAFERAVVNAPTPHIAVKKEPTDVPMPDTKPVPSLRSPIRLPVKAEPAPVLLHPLPTAPRKHISASEHERQLYLDYMATFPQPVSSALARGTKPVTDGLFAKSLIQTADTISSRDSLFLRKRTIWCSASTHTHALGFVPTHVYIPSQNRWVPEETVTRQIGREVNFFVQVGRDVFYAGVYVVRDLRRVHPPGSVLPDDVSYRALLTAMNLEERLPDGRTRFMSERIFDFFPDGRVHTECFGFQCVGFDEGLFEELLRRFDQNGARNVRESGSRSRSREDWEWERERERKRRMEDDDPNEARLFLSLHLITSAVLRSLRLSEPMTRNRPPILTIPAEVTIEIFRCVACAPIELPRPGRVLPAPFVFGLVCREWRSISRATPELWTQLTVVMRGDIPIEKPIRWRAAAARLLSGWIDASKAFPVSISLRIVAPRASVPIGVFIDAIRRAASRIEGLRLEDVPADCVAKLFDGQERIVLPLLRRIQVEHSALPEKACFFDGLAITSPLLTDVALLKNRGCHLPNGLHGRLQRVIFHDLEQLMTLALLVSLPELRDCTLRCSGAAIPQGQPAVIHSRLEELTLETTLTAFIFQHMHLPRLQHLTLGVDLGTGWLAHLGESLAPGSHSVRRLTLCVFDDGQALPNSDLSAILVAFPNLERLDYVAHETTALMTLLSPWRPTLQSIRVPALTELRVELRQLLPEYLSIVALLEDRIKAVDIHERRGVEYRCDRMRSLELVLGEDVAPPPPDVLARFEELRDMGMDISVRR